MFVEGGSDLPHQPRKELKLREIYFWLTLLKDYFFFYIKAKNVIMLKSSANFFLFSFDKFKINFPLIDWFHNLIFKKNWKWKLFVFPYGNIAPIGIFRCVCHKKDFSDTLGFGIRPAVTLILENVFSAEKRSVLTDTGQFIKFNKANA